MFKYEGQQYTKEEVEKAAKEKNLSVEDYIKKYNITQIEEPDPVKKSTTPPDAGVETDKASDMVSPSEDGSLEYTGAEPLEEYKATGSEFIDEGGAKLRQAGGGEFDPLQLEGVTVTAEQINNEIDTTSTYLASDFIKLLSPAGRLLALNKASDAGVEFLAGDSKKSQQMKNEDIAVGRSIYNTLVNGINQFSGLDEQFGYMGAYIVQDQDIMKNLLGEKLGGKLAKKNREGVFKYFNNKLTKINSLGLQTINFTDLSKRNKQIYDIIDGKKVYKAEDTLKNLGSFVDTLGGGVAAALDGIGSFATSAAIYAGTGGSGLFAQMASQSIKNANDIKAQSFGITTEQLLNRNQGEFITPLGLATIGFSLERFGLKGVQNYINTMSPGAGKGLLNLMSVGGREGGTEWGQGVIEEFNKSIAQKGLSTSDIVRYALNPTSSDAKSVAVNEAVKQAWEYGQSPEGLENLYKGFIGAQGSGLGASYFKARANIRTSSQNSRIAEDVKAFASLEDQKTKRNLNREEIAELNKAQVKIKERLTSTLNENDQVIAALTEDQIELINISASNIQENQKKISETRNFSKNLSPEARKNLIKDYQEEINFSTQIISDIRNTGERIIANIDKTKEVGKLIEGVEVRDFANAEEINTFIEEQGLQNVDKKASEEQAFIIQDPNTKQQTIIINRDQSARDRSVTQGFHEAGHALLYKTIQDNPETALNLKNALKKEIDAIDADQVKDSNFKSRLEQYKNETEEVQAEEYLTLFSEALLTGDIKFEENIQTKIGDIVRRGLQALGVKVKFDTGRDVYNFLKDFNKSVEKGTLSVAQIELAREGATGELVAPKTEQTDKETTTKLSKATLFEEINKLVPDNIKTKTEFDNFVRSPQGAKLFNSIYNEGGAINNYIRQRATTPEESQKIIDNTIERVLNFNPESTRDDGGTVGIEGFTERIMADTRFAKLDAKKDLFKESERAKQEQQLDSPQAAQVAATETTPTETTKQQTSKLRRDLGIKQGDDLYNAVKQTAKEIFGKDLDNVELKKLKAIVNKKARGSELFKDIAKLMGTEKAIDPQFLNKNILNILKDLPVSDLVKLERGTKGKKIFTKTGPRLGPIAARKAVSEGLLPKNTNINSGPRVSEKLPVTLEQAKEFFTQKRKAGLVGVIAENLVADAAPSVTKEIKTPSKRRAEVLDVIDRDPELKFAKRLDEQNVFKNITEDDAKDFSSEKFIWRSYVKLLGQKFLDSKNKKDVQEFKDWFVENIPKYFSKSIITTGTFANAGESAAERGFFFTSINEINELVEGKKFQKENKNIAEAAKRQGYTTGTGENRRITPSFLKNLWQTDKLEEQNTAKLKGLEDMFIIFQKMIKDNKDNARFIAAILSSTSQGMGHIITAAPIKFISKNLQGAIVEEHTLPASLVAKYLFKSAIQGKVKENFKNIERNYFQGVLSKQDDNKLKGVAFGEKYNYTQVPPLGWNLDDNIWARYFNLDVASNNFGIDPNSLELNNGKTVYDVYGVDNSGNFIDDQFNKELKKVAVINNNMLPVTVKFSKGNTFNNNVLQEMKNIDNTSTAEELTFSKDANLSKGMNDIIEAKTGIASEKTYSRVKAEVVGANKGRFDFFIPPSAEDFVGLLYKTLSKSKLGDSQMAWYKAHLINPYARAMDNISRDRVALMNDFKALKKELKVVPKTLKKKVPGEGFTQEQAVRTYIWDKQGMTIPGMAGTDIKTLVDFVNKNPDLVTFADQLIAMQKGDQYAAPSEGWLAGSITTDLIEGINTIKRSKYLEVWQTNADQIFSEANLNKLEAAYGKDYRVALENSLQRMKTGKNRSFGGDTLTGRVTDWLTNSIGAIMFFNTRSAVLQTISAINFINFSDNNIYKAGKAFANQKQYWKDFKTLFNSDFLIERRDGLRLNVNEADIADMAKKGGVRGVISELLRLGFLPTQIADSFAIASGGSTFYRNRIKALEKQGLSTKEAETKAFQDFRETAEESQQSSRPDRISQQQAGPLGRIILAFANTPAQYARIIKKAASDLKNRRGDDKTNISKIIYYGVAQNLIFNALQQALFGLAFGDDEEELTEKEKNKKEKRYINVANGMADSLLRGMGLGGAVFSVLKNTALRLSQESDKKSPKYQDVLVKEIAQISPPISSKLGKLRQAGRSYSWNRKEMMEKGWSIDNPAYLAAGQVIAATTNIPLDRAFKKIDNIRNASNSDLEAWQRVASAAGWSAWELGIDKNEKADVKLTRSEEIFELNKKDQVDLLLKLGLTKKEINKLKLEKDRVEAIINKEKNNK